MKKDRIYTRTGDRGSTGLIGGGRIPKDSLRISAYGLVDGLNADLGLAVALAETLEEPSDDRGKVERLIGIVQSIQRQLFVAGAELASPTERREPTIPMIEQDAIEELEKWIDEIEGCLEPLREFILPGGGLLSAQLHVCRCRCRTAERACVALAHEEFVGEPILAYMNRLSDLCFVLARWATRLASRSDLPWKNA